MKSFSEFVDKKTRETKRQLELISKVLQKEGVKVQSFLHETDDPYIYVEDPGKQLTFGGIRIYKIGDSISFRVQKEQKTHPYGKAYPLDIEAMFKDLTSDDKSEGEAGKIVMRAINKEVRSFFIKSGDAEKELRDSEFDRGDSIGLASTGGTDYSSLIHNAGRQYGTPA